MVGIIGVILTLVLMEGLLSVDNALVLATMAGKVKDLDLRKKALYYGLVGAIAFRAILVFAGVLLTKLWWIKIIGALYLASLVRNHFSGKEGGDDDEKADKIQRFVNNLLARFGIKISVFWATVISIELMDLTFSADSILASLAISNKFYVLIIGGALGIAMMRGVAGVFMKLIEKVPEMEHTAFILIAIISIKMFLSTVHEIVGLFGVHMAEIEVSDVLFFGILVVTFGLTFVVHFAKKSKPVQN